MENYGEAHESQPVYFLDPNSGEWDWHPKDRLPRRPSRFAGCNLFLTLGVFAALWIVLLLLIFALAEIMEWCVT